MIGAGNFALYILAFSSTSLALPSIRSTRRDDADFVIPPPLGDQFRKCYPATDPDFFAQDERRPLRYNDCSYVLRDLAREFKVQSFEPRQLWYTSDRHIPPSGLDRDAIQLPIIRQIHGCAVAILSHKALGDLVQSTGINWREEWGIQPTPSSRLKQVFDGVAPHDWLGDRGISTALGCVNDNGEAGYKRVGKSCYLIAAPDVRMPAFRPLLPLFLYKDPKDS